MKLEHFGKGDVIYRTKPTKWKSYNPMRLWGFEEPEEREDRSYMSSPYIFSEIQGNLCLIKDAKDGYIGKLELDKYNDDNWDFYPVFAEEVGKFINLMIDPERNCYVSKDARIEAPKII